MGSMSEPDRKRRHIGSVSLPATTPKKPSFFPSTEDKKLDTTVLQYQNQKLVQKLEVQRTERLALEHKLCQLNELQKPYETSLEEVSRSWGMLVDALESCSTHTMSQINGLDGTCSIATDSDSSQVVDQFLSRLIETGSAESCSSTSPYQLPEDVQILRGRTQRLLSNIVVAINELWNLKDRILAFVSKALPEDGSQRETTSGLEREVRTLRLGLGELHLQHKSLRWQMQNHGSGDARNKALLRHLRGELESSVAELGESNCQLATLKLERDEGKGMSFPVLNMGGKHSTADRTRDKHKDLQDMESTHTELLYQASERLLELKGLHEERIGILKQLSQLQNILKNVKCVFFSQAYLMAGDQLATSKAEVAQYQVLFEKLQVERDNLAWREKDLNFKNDLVEVYRRSSSISDARVNELMAMLQKQLGERNLIESKLEKASTEPGRKEIIAEFKDLVSSFPENMGTMQGQLSSYKEAAAEVHALLADVQSLSIILDGKAQELETLSVRSVELAADLFNLQAIVQDLEGSEIELKLILEMFRRESSDTRDVLEARSSEYRAWARVQCLRFSLDEHRLEFRVKTANEAEARSQQRLAAAEAEIADMRQKLEASKRDLSRLSNILKCKNEENEVFLSEIETIGQAYDDMQNQNQHLLQQITERDDYNIKLYLEGARARQLQDALLIDKLDLEKGINQFNASLIFLDLQAAKVEDQLKLYEDQIHNFREERQQFSSTLENFQKKIVDVKSLSQQSRELVEESQMKIGKSRVKYAEMRIELEKERFLKKRMEEELELAKRKASILKAQTDRSSVVGKLQRELREYREILKCSICLDRPKEVVITKCYHLFCYSCVQRTIETRHRKCPVCATSFGPNDVKPVYI